MDSNNIIPKPPVSSVPPPPPPDDGAAPKRVRKPRVVKPKAPKKPKYTPEPKNFTTYSVIAPESLYQPAYCDALIKHRAQGMGYESFAGLIKVSRKTLYRWEKIFPQWVEAKEKAEDECLLHWEKLGVLGAAGKIKGFNAIGFIYNTRNRLRKDFKNNPEETPEAKPIDPRPLSERTNDPIEAARQYLKTMRGE